MKWPRWAHHLYADRHGYFWIQCGKCGRMFGGHEQGGGRIVRDVVPGLVRGDSTCPRCPGTYLQKKGRLFEVSEHVLSDLATGATDLDRATTIASVREDLDKPGTIG